MSYRVSYTRPPTMHIRYECDGLSCGIGTVEHNGDAFVCSDCGTSWSNDYDDGQLYEQRSGETPESEPVDPDDWKGRAK